jgi:phage shock protein E
MFFDRPKQLFSPAPAPDFAVPIAKGTVVVDVRTASEYDAGHVLGTTNIPLDLLGRQVAGLKQKIAPIITVCRSSARSGLAKKLLTDAGIEAYNGGALQTLHSKIA